MNFFKYLSRLRLDKAGLHLARYSGNYVMVDKVTIYLCEIYSVFSKPKYY